MCLDNKCILYVDDDEDDRTLLREAIVETGEPVQVHTAENGLIALELLYSWIQKAQKLPCLIVLDLNMPYLNGRETYNRLQNNPSLQQVPVVIYSSGNKPQERLQFEASGVIYIPKPSDMSHLKLVARKMVEVCQRA